MGKSQIPIQRLCKVTQMLSFCTVRPLWSFKRFIDSAEIKVRHIQKQVLYESIEIKMKYIQNQVLHEFHWNQNELYTKSGGSSIPLKSKWNIYKIRCFMNSTEIKMKYIQNQVLHKFHWNQNEIYTKSAASWIPLKSKWNIIYKIRYLMNSIKIKWNIYKIRCFMDSTEIKNEIYTKASAW